jgi:hypothetical protein
MLTAGRCAQCGMSATLREESARYGKHCSAACKENAQTKVDLVLMILAKRASSGERKQKARGDATERECERGLRWLGSSCWRRRKQTRVSSTVVMREAPYTLLEHSADGDVAFNPRRSPSIRFRLVLTLLPNDTGDNNFDNKGIAAS